ncbi:hypothetical protein [Streptomyces tanashiensis]|jgi:hypothetical protein|uniref:Secreted protein n=1 Tax=Streptomyces tanashiensis TaxID=67367 RepID=A0ABY6R1N9_9ACTN|nr:hypothetical protein [Streptomyces tanashiensis]UZX23410.1 hypothetical protein LDH80_23000 [Streptomyces tanashiensis]GGY40220.1 hypothetical protein GCM10010299_53320 [Streptomyces tanashiensis]
MVRTRLKLAATLTVVVLALTGFHTGKGGHGSSGGGSGKSKSGKSRSHSDSDDDSGGGCSSDEKSNDDYSGSGGSTASASPSPTSAKVEVEVVDCVKPAQRKRKGRPARKADTTSTLRITSHDALEGTYEVTLEFKAATGSAVESVATVVTVGAYEDKTFEVAMKSPKAVDRVKSCYVYDVRKK